MPQVARILEETSGAVLVAVAGAESASYDGVAAAGVDSRSSLIPAALGDVISFII